MQTIPVHNPAGGIILRPGGNEPAFVLRKDEIVAALQRDSLPSRAAIRYDPSTMIKTIEWSDEGVVMIDQRRLPTHELYPIFKTHDEVAVAIEDMVVRGAPADPVFDSLAEALLKAEHGGAIAAWASSGMTLPQDQSVMTERLYRLLFSATAGKSMTLGEATRKAKSTIANNDVRRSWIFLGDSPTKLR